MIHWRQLPGWSLRAWPLLALFPAFAVHWVALRHFADATSLVNKIAGMLLQSCGGLLILYSINDNLGLFRRQSLLAAAAGWLRSFPVVRKSVTISLSGVASAAMSGTATVTTGKVPTTIEERVAQLEEGLKVLRQEVASNATVAQRQLQEAKVELSGRIDVTAGQVADLTKKVEHAAVGGFKVQAFGVLLAIYGAIASVFA